MTSWLKQILIKKYLKIDAKRKKSGSHDQNECQTIEIKVLVTQQKKLD